MMKGPCTFLVKIYTKRWPTSRCLAFLGTTCGSASFYTRCKPCGFHVISTRRLGSSNGNGVVDKASEKKKVPLDYPEKTVTVYTCENIYKNWKRDRTFYRVPSSGVFAKIPYIDTIGKSESDRPPKTVLCIHGIPGNYSVFSHLITELANQGIRVVVPTFPATLYLPGKSRTELFRHSAEEKTQVFKDFLKALNISKLDGVIAHSSAIYPALRLILDPELKVKCQAFFNTGGHKKTVTMKPYWVVWTCSYLYLHPLGRKFIQKTGKFIMKYILRTPIKDDNLDGIMLLAITMVFSQYWKAKDQFEEIARKQRPTLYCFSEDDKVVERKLTYEVVSLLGASTENVSFLDKDANVVKKGKEFPWLNLLSFDKGSHYVFRKHPEICTQKVLELLKEIDNKTES